METLQLILKIARTFIDPASFAEQVQTVLAIAGTGLNTGRAYLFMENPDGTGTREAFEWCNSGIPPNRERLLEDPYDNLPSWTELLRENGSIVTDDVATLDDEIARLLKARRVRSIAVYPLEFRQEHRGYIGFDGCLQIRNWSPSDLFFMETVANLLCNAYAREVSRNLGGQAEKNFRTFVETIEDLFIIAGMNGKIVHTNNAACRTLGYSLSDMRKLHLLDLHHEDNREEATNTLNAMFRGERALSRLELKTRSGSLIPAETRIWAGTWNDRECIFCLAKDLRSEHEALQKFVKLFENNPALMSITDIADRHITEVNTAFVEKTGYSPEEVVGHSAEELELFPDGGTIEEISGILKEKGTVRNKEIELRCKNGKTLFGLVSGDILEYQGKRFFLTVMVDISDQVELRTLYANQNQRFESIIESANLGTWEWNITTSEMIVNERWAEIVGYSVDELAPISLDTWKGLLHPEDLAAVLELLDRNLSRETTVYEVEFRMRHKTGYWVWILARGKITEWTAKGKPLRMFGTHSEIGEKKEMENRIREISIRDPLTNLYNRRYIFERMEALVAQHIRSKTMFSVTILDLDHFKNVNDTWGHLAGDYVLKEIAQIIQSRLRPYDLSGRYGGEEFVILSMSENRKQAHASIERILEIVRSTEFAWNGQRIRCSFSAGVADTDEIPANLITNEKLIAIADSRLYMAKLSGRDRVLSSDVPGDAGAGERR